MGIYFLSLNGTCIHCVCGCVNVCLWVQVRYNNYLVYTQMDAVVRMCYLLAGTDYN